MNCPLCQKALIRYKTERISATVKLKRYKCEACDATFKECETVVKSGLELICERGIAQ